ncbi:MAG: hypothetical protein M1337_05885 [Actinobacteria bacterium]|nr:hypothetical protein [Actinomycetota bacterium]
MSNQFDFANFIGLLFLLGGIALWSFAVFAFLSVLLLKFLLYTVLGFVMAITGGYLLKPPGSRGR